MDKIVQVYKHDGTINEGLISFNLNSLPWASYLPEEVFENEAEIIFESLLIRLPGGTLKALVKLMIDRGIDQE